MNPQLDGPERHRFIELLREGAGAADVQDSEETRAAARSEPVNDEFLERELNRVNGHLRLLSQLRDHLPANPESILDAGCSTGAGSAALALTYPLSMITSIDPDTKSLEAARVRLRGLSLDRGVTFVANVSGEPFPLESASFDMVVSCSVLEFISTTEKQAHYLGELQRVARPGARILVITPNRFAIEAPHLRTRFGYLRRRGDAVPWIRDEAWIDAHFTACRKIRLQHAMVAAKLRRRRIPALFAPVVSFVSPWMHYLYEKPLS